MGEEIVLRILRTKHPICSVRHRQLHFLSSETLNLLNDMPIE